MAEVNSCPQPMDVHLLFNMFFFAKNKFNNGVNRGGSSVRPLMQVMKSYFLPMKC